MKITDMNSPEFIKFWVSKIKELIIKELNGRQCVKEWAATVVAVGTGTADVKIAGDNVNILAGLKNKTGVTLNVNDLVYVHSPTGNLTNSWISVKF